MGKHIPNWLWPLVQGYTGNEILKVIGSMKRHGGGGVNYTPKKKVKVLLPDRKRPYSGPTGVTKKRRKTETDHTFPYPGVPTITDEEEDHSSKSAKMGGSGYSRWVKRGRRVTRSDPYRTSAKIERGLRAFAWNAVYVGGATHPVYQVLSEMCKSIIRFMMLRANIDFPSFNSACVIPGTSTQTFTISYWWREETGFPTALSRRNVTSGGISTWSQLVSALADKFVEDFSSTTGGRVLVYIGLNGNGVTPVIATQFYSASDLTFTCKGESNIQVQNRTEADSGAVAEDRQEATNIYCNPLRGKYYTMKYGYGNIKNPGEVTGPQFTRFMYNSQDGHVATSDRFGTPGPGVSNFNLVVEELIRKPPPGYFFSNCATTKRVEVKPGQILKANIQHRESHHIDTWLSMMQVKFQQAAVKTLTGLIANEDPVDWRCGKMHVFGLEKMVDTDKPVADEIGVGLEQNLYISGRLKYFPKYGTLPAVSITTQ